jgi:integrase
MRRGELAHPREPDKSVRGFQPRLVDGQRPPRPERQPRIPLALEQFFLRCTAEFAVLGCAKAPPRLRAVPVGGLGRLDRLLYLTAAMTGLRQGELLALRWRDVDWSARRVRVRQSYVRGEFGRPKSKRSSRSVPLASRLASELQRHHEATAWRAADDLVFGHPELGTPLERSRLRKRFKRYLARVRNIRFHDLRIRSGRAWPPRGRPLRTLQEWMGHRDFKNTLIYADYQPSAHEAEFVERAFAGPRAAAGRP